MGNRANRRELYGRAVNLPDFPRSFRLVRSMEYARTPKHAGALTCAVAILATIFEVAHVGAFLSVWAAPQHRWTHTRIELSHVADKINPVRDDANVLISATYIADR